MSARTIVVAHREAMVAEGLAAALDRYPWCAARPTATAAEALGWGQRADAVALDQALPGAEEAATTLRRRGVRVVLIGEDGALGNGHAEEEGLRVSTRSPIAALVSALVPEAGKARRNGLPLSPREQEVLELSSRGLAGKQVARQLGISPKTVERHKTRIYAKLGVPNQAAAVRAALTPRPEVVAI